MIGRTPRKVAIQTPAKIAHLFERVTSKGPSFLSLLASTELCAFASSRGGVVNRGSRSEDIEGLVVSRDMPALGF